MTSHIADIWQEPVPTWFIAPLLIVAALWIIYESLIVPIYLTVVYARKPSRDRDASALDDDDQPSKLPRCEPSDVLIMLGFVAFGISAWVWRQTDWSRWTMLPLAVGIWISILAFILSCCGLAYWIAKRRPGSDLKQT